MHTARLRLVHSTPERQRFCSESTRVRFAQDRERLLWAASEKTGRTYGKPLEALSDLVRLFDFKQGRKPLRGDAWGETDPRNGVLWLCQNLRSKLEFPQSLRQVEAFTLAHEFAHVRLHLPRIIRGELTERMEREADVYAAVFLVPRRQMVPLPAFAALQVAVSSDEIEQRAGELARHFGVTRTAMLHSLEDLGLVVRDRVTREIGLAERAARGLELVG